MPGRCSSASEPAPPGCSTAYTVCSPASASRKGSQNSPPAPCRNSTGEPVPATRTRALIGPTSTIRSATWSGRLGAVVVTVAPSGLRTGGHGPDGGPGRPPLVRPPLGVPDPADARHDLLGEQRDVLLGQLVGHRADLQQRVQVAHPQRLRGLDQP